MSRTAILYGVIGLAALAAGILIPYLIHRSGSLAVPGWQGLITPGAVSEKHQFIAQECESCHTPHVGVEAKNCIACHTTSRFESKESTRFHTTIGECRGCHVEHEGGVRPTTMEHEVLAATAYARAFPDGRLTTEAERLRTFAKRLGMAGNHRMELAHLNCASCHTNRDPHRQLFGTECGTCHEVTTWSVVGFRHPSPASTDCAQCHQAPPSHYMGHFEMVSQKVAKKEHAPVEQCYQCHTTDAWNNIKGVGWYKHH